MMKGPFGPGTIVLGGGALLLFGVLAIGFFLPTTWAVGADTRIDAPAEDVMAFLDSPEGWQAWTTWPDSSLARSGPDRGPGAAMSWDDQELGSGRFEIGEVTATSVTYSVEVAGAGGTVMETRGKIEVHPEGTGVRVAWTEEGDLGRNPLMGFWALTMESAQTRELGKSLDQLATLVTGAEGSPAQPAGGR